VLDLGESTGAAARTAIRLEIDSLPYATTWRSLVVTGTAMPKELPGNEERSNRTGRLFSAGSERLPS
jgi:nitroimidazol reductase NimA-like FMN-containing flavoprotein (pyridoxamine 5'-phosphate oxidase superfamily)